MKRAARKIFVLAVCVVVMSIAGCAEQELPSVKKSRLIAAENMRLTKQLERRDREIESIKELHNKESKKQEKLLAKCVQEKESWKQKARQNVRNQVKGVFDAVMEQNAKLREENEKLKAQIEKLQQ
jgi:chromosome condensin MukBEF ATPase and DNA-binding subunit MukB